jgi:hypothetical protein
MREYFENKSKRIKSGEEYTLYLVYCNECKKYKRICASPPAGPGGTLSCPICAENKENGPHLEMSYGSVKAKSFKIILPKCADI